MLDKWYWRSVFSQYYISATETKIQRTVRQWLSREGEKQGWLVNRINEPDSVRDFSYRVSILDDVSRIDNAIYRGVISLLLSKKVRDFGQGHKTLGSVPWEEIEDHHIYPKRFLTPYGIKGDKVNNIANRTPLTRTTNGAIGNTAPHVYLEDMKIIGGDPIQPIISAHLINPALALQPFTAALYDEFLADRRGKNSLSSIAEVVEREAVGGIACHVLRSRRHRHRPRRLCLRHSRRAARPQGRRRRKGQDLRRHLPQHRLHSLQGAAARLRNVRGGRRMRWRRSASSSAPPKLDLAAMMKHKDDTVAANVNGVGFLFKKNKIDRLHRHRPDRGAGPGRGRRRRRRRSRCSKPRTSSSPPARMSRRCRGSTIDEKIVVSLDRRAVACHACRKGSSSSAPASSASSSARSGGGSARRSWSSNSSTASCPAWTARSPGSSSACSRSRASSSTSRTRSPRWRRRPRAPRSPSSRPPAATPQIVRGRCRARRHRPPALHGRARAGGGRRRDRARPCRHRRPFRHQRAGHLRDRRRRARPDARPQGRGRGHRGRRDPRRPARPRELRRHSGRRLHEPRNRRGRQDRGGAEGRGHRLSGRQISVHAPMAAPAPCAAPTVS